MRHWLLVWIALMVGSTTISAQTTMTGVVRDSSGRSLHGVDVFLVGSSGRATTDSTGTYVVSPGAAGEYVARFRKLGYKPAMLTARLTTTDTLRVNVILAPGDAQPLDPIDVRASMPRGTRAAFE